ncbi:MAG: asparaginase [Anaerolineales bacterium]|nr:MAG: asparaginase [Anaerolineales bacterium]
MPTIVILTTGGTIAMKRDEAAGGAVPTLDGSDFLAALPPGLPELRVEEYCNLPSAHFALDTLWGLRSRVAELLDKPEVDGVVVTHGTDVMEESAYLLDLTVPGEKPMVLTGAMRTASQIGYEGLANLVAAVRVAASPQARRLGAMIVMNDEIHAARFVTKAHTQSVDTFKSLSFGPLGRVDGDEVVIGQRVTRQWIPGGGLESNVVLIKLAVGLDESFLKYAIEKGVKGVVIEALGGGRVPPWWMPTIRQAVEAGVAVVIASRCPSGRVWDGYGYEGAYNDLRGAGVLFANGLNGQKARLKLMVVLEAAEDRSAIPQLWAS